MYNLLDYIYIYIYIYIYYLFVFSVRSKNILNYDKNYIPL